MPRTLVTVLVLPAAAVAGGMHFVPDFRALVERTFPGATDALKRVTGVNYVAPADPDRERSTLPDNYEKLPDLMKRIEKERRGSGDSGASGAKAGDATGDFLGKAMAATAAGAREAAVNGSKMAEKMEGTVKFAAGAAKSTGDAVSRAVGGLDGKDTERGAPAASPSSWFSFGSKKPEADVVPASDATTASTPAAAETSKASSDRGSKTSSDGVGKLSSAGRDAADVRSSLAKGAAGALSSGTREASDSTAFAAGRESSATHRAAGEGSSPARNASDASDASSHAPRDAADAVESVARSAPDPTSSAPGEAPVMGEDTVEKASPLARDAANTFPHPGRDAEDAAFSLSGDAAGATESSRWSRSSADETAPVAQDSVGNSLTDKLGVSSSGGAAPSVRSGNDDTNKFARLFGRGDFDPAAVDGKDVVDVSVYKRPTWSRGPAFGSRSVAASENGNRGGGGGGGGGSLSLTSLDGLAQAEQQVEALQAELKSQAKWDAVRLQEAVRAQSVAEKKLAAAEIAAVVKKHRVELAEAKEAAAVEAQRALEAKTGELEAGMVRRREVEVAKLLGEREAGLRASLEAEYLGRERVAADERQRQLVDLKASVDSLHGDLERGREHQRASLKAGSVAASAFSLKDALEGSGSFAKQLEMASRTGELGQLITMSIPRGAGQQGLPTVDDLKSSFANVAREGRKAALVPERDVGTIWGHLLASVVSRMKVAVDMGSSPHAPFTDEERVRLAEKHMAAGDLAKAVESLEGLGGLAAEIASDWVAAANARIAADLGAQALLADAIVTQRSLAAMPARVEDRARAECCS